MSTNSSSSPLVLEQEHGGTAPLDTSLPSSKEADPGSLQQQQQPRRKRVEYYAEENFKGADLSRHVHVGWGVAGGTAVILLCMGMSAITQSRSWNVSFLWLQRRVGAQFMTLSYMVTDNLLHYFDGDKWVTRDWFGPEGVFSRYGKTNRKQQQQLAPASFAASGLQPQ